VRFSSEVTAPVEVEVLAYTPAYRPRSGGPPDYRQEAEPADLEVRVTLGAVDVTEALPADVLEALRAEALEQLDG